MRAMSLDSTVTLLVTPVPASTYLVRASEISIQIIGYINAHNFGQSLSSPPAGHVFSMEYALSTSLLTLTILTLLDVGLNDFASRES